MSDESELRVTPKGENSSLRLSKNRSGLISRGLRDAASLAELSSLGGTMSIKEVLHLCLRAAKGDAEAQKRLFYDTSKGANQGRATSQYLLGKSYRQGWEPVERDPVEAVRWYLKAAEQGHESAIFELAEMYEKGEGVATNRTEALRWYRVACDEDWEAREDYDENLVTNMWGRAADLGYAKGQYLFGTCVYQKNHAQGAEWFRKAADQGHAGAQYLLGMLYEEGLGVPQDRKEAVRWYRMAAEQRDVDAQFSLSLMYASGQGVPHDHIQAHMWSDLAGATGHAASIQLRDEIASEMTPHQIAAAQRLAREWELTHGQR